VQGTATNVVDDTDTLVYIPVTPYSANASLETLWVLVELFLTDGSTYSSVQRLPAPFQSYPIHPYEHSHRAEFANRREERQANNRPPRQHWYIYIPNYGFVP